jgi:SHS2 domain-containing protein
MDAPRSRIVGRQPTNDAPRNRIVGRAARERRPAQAGSRAGQPTSDAPRSPERQPGSRLTMEDARPGRFRWADHTGELELEIEAGSEEAVYAAAVSAMSQLLEDTDDPGAGRPRDARAAEATAREIAVEAPDRARLLAELLGELAFLAETEGFVPEALERLAVDERRLHASVRGHAGDPPHLVKAATLHRLAFDADAGGWRARVVLDV